MDNDSSAGDAHAGASNMMTPHKALEAVAQIKSGKLFSQGDVALVRCGRGDRWRVVDNRKYYNGEPGVGLEACQWLVAKGACMVGADNRGVEVTPEPDRERNFPCHHLLLTMHDLFMFETLSLEAPVEEVLVAGAFFFGLVPVKGATGSPGDPILIG